MDSFIRAFLLLFVLLNPFIMSVYLGELVSDLDLRTLARHLLRGAGISLIVFLFFAWAGNAVFEDVLQVRFSSFLVFGGITFLIIGIRLILGVGPAVRTLKPDAEEISASIAMPLIVGPGTISASVIAGTRLPLPLAAAAITLALAAAMAAILLFKRVTDFVRERNEPLVARYTEVAGRITALFTGTFAVEMIFNGINGWMRGTG